MEKDSKKDSYIRPRQFSLIRDHRFGFGVLPSVLDICTEYKWRNPVIITGEKTYSVAGKQLEELLVDKNFEVQVVKAKVNGTVSLTYVDEVCSQNKNPACIIGVGGGSKLDLAKLVAEIYNCQMISVPTSVSHDGIASNIASVIDENGERQSKHTVMPIALIVDTDIIQTAPSRLNIAGVGEAISNFVAVEDWRLASKKFGKDETNYSKHAYLIASGAVQFLVKKIDDMPDASIKDIVDTIILSHIGSGMLMSVIGSSQPCSGAEHKFSHVLDRDYKTGAMHGEQVGVGSIVTAYLQASKLSLRQIKRSFMFSLSWEKIKRSLRKIGAPASAGEIHLEPEQVIEAFIEARKFRPERYTILDKVSDSSIKKAVNKTIA